MAEARLVLQYLRGSQDVSGMWNQCGAILHPYDSHVIWCQRPGDLWFVSRIFIHAAKRFHFFKQDSVLLVSLPSSAQ
ncbi:hypothetical protein CLOM_g16877 [Closterium sp. NIES-68]|nr:hypothetical protein CLOM_g16877 [Closterium sp. NIES-68]